MSFYLFYFVVSPEVFNNDLHLPIIFHFSYSAGKPDKKIPRKSIWLLQESKKNTNRQKTLTLIECLYRKDIWLFGLKHWLNTISLVTWHLWIQSPWSEHMPDPTVVSPTEKDKCSNRVSEHIFFIKSLNCSPVDMIRNVKKIQCFFSHIDIF